MKPIERKLQAPLIPPLGMAYAAREANKALEARQARERMLTQPVEEVTDEQLEG